MYLIYLYMHGGWVTFTCVQDALHIIIIIILATMLNVEYMCRYLFGPCIGCFHPRTETTQICKHMQCQWAQQYYLCVFSLSYRLLMYASRFRASAYYVAAATLLLLHLSSRKHLTYWVHKISSNTYTHTSCIEWSCTEYRVHKHLRIHHFPYIRENIAL